MDDHDWAKWEAYYEPKLPRDHPRCDECSEHLFEDDMDHDGDAELCNYCGIVCDACNEKATKKEIKDGTSYHKDVKNLCIYCIELVDEGELEPDEIHPMFYPFQQERQPCTQ